VTIDEIVEDHRAVTQRQQLADAMTADVAGSPNNENIHGRGLYCFPEGDG
jgi:hypothetical protein